VLTAAALVFGAPLTAQAASKPSTSVPSGNDVSWPQCGKTLPSAQAFGIVGVNNGLANAANPCFSTEWSWAQRSRVVTKQPAASVYVNTANPELSGSWWPKGDTTQQGQTIHNPYGSCDGSANAACAYLYGWSKAYDDVHSWGVPVTAGLRWWLDVETGNSWSSTNLAANRADLEAMVTVLTNSGGVVGVYSTRSQFGAIVGAVPGDSPLAGLPSWLAGASSAKAAQSACSSTPLTAGSTVALVQYVSGGFDYDVSCAG